MQTVHQSSGSKKKPKRNKNDQVSHSGSIAAGRTVMTVLNGNNQSNITCVTITSEPSVCGAMDGQWAASWLGRAKAARRHLAPRAADVGHEIHERGQRATVGSRPCRTPSYTHRYTRGSMRRINRTPDKSRPTPTARHYVSCSLLTHGQTLQLAT